MSLPLRGAKRLSSEDVVEHGLLILLKKHCKKNFFVAFDKIIFPMICLMP